MRSHASLRVLPLLCAVALVAATPSAPRCASPLALRLDGATIVNSGSTNAAGWTIVLHSDARASIDGRSFALSRALVQKFFDDVAAARNARVAGRACMKSISFGTHLNVTWHGWESPDLSCPMTSGTEAALADDVSHVVAVANPPSGMRRVRLPAEPRRIPPTPKGEPFGAPKSREL